ncbi:short chain type dehydrogenase [Penicillium hetheringtonii]|uniref:Short chain type dehydrogenase n=1 Tax=Penicillium hetheringtonii TaxID=911720 RepID=A0AAD6H133_9EURO|nr:short chain type dehydrogenase [Penicillium hetheringtonii]
MSLQGKVALLTGASMGIGEAIASSLVEAGANVILFSRSELKEKLAVKGDAKITYRAVDVGNYEEVDTAVTSSIQEVGHIDILINNAGLAIGAPKIFSDLNPSEIMTMNNTNINGYMFTTHSVLNHSMMNHKAGTILNITSITGLEVPPFPGEAVYHANKACQEAFTNALRNELSGTDIRVLALRPGVVATNFHSLRVGHDKKMYDEFIEGYEPLVAGDIAQGAIYMLQQPLNISVKALDIVPSAQRSINVFDRTWNERRE